MGLDVVLRVLERVLGLLLVLVVGERVRGSPGLGAEGGYLVRVRGVVARHGVAVWVACVVSLSAPRAKSLWAKRRAE